MNTLTRSGHSRTVCAARWFLCVLGLFWLALSATQAEARQPPSPAPAVNRPQTGRVGQYRVPDLPGWNRVIKRWPARSFTRTYSGKTRRYQVPARSKAIYTRTVDGSALTLFLEAADAKKPVSAKRDLLPGIQMGQKIMGMMSGVLQKKTGSGYTPTPIQTETFRGQAAYVMVFTWTNRQGGVSESRTRSFAGKTFGYEQEQTIEGTAKGTAITARARATASDGWKKLSDGLRDMP